ncbi:MAG: Uma2 family endonuclease, partial [candidate division WOR-3 bacterium]
MNTEVKEKVWTYEDYLKLEDDKRYEVINGRLVEMPAPTPWHQDISRNLLFLLWGFVKGKDLGKIYHSPIDIVLREDVVLQPDIVYISKEKLGIVGEKAVNGTPDLVVEIVSPSTARRDTVVKKGIYENFGVKEYWIVYPDEKAIEVWVLNESGKYELYSFAEKEGKVKSKVLEGLEVDL